MPTVATPTQPDRLLWETAEAAVPFEIAGNIELRLDAATTGTDTAWIAILHDVAPDGAESPISGGWLRASMRAVDEEASVPGAPVVPCTTTVAVPIGEMVTYRIPVVPNARHIAAGHRIRLLLTSSDQQDPDDGVASSTILGFRHGEIGIPAHNTVASSSRLLLPILD